MNFVARRLILASSMLLAMGLSGQVRADWAQSADPLAVVPGPANSQLLAQNPPTFTWSRHPTNPTSYVIEIYAGNSLVSTFTSKRNWYLPAKALPYGTYTWRVRPATLSTWSTDRTFVVNSTSTVFEVPMDDVLQASILKKPHPRGLQAGLPMYKTWTPAMHAERDWHINQLINEVTTLTASVAPVKDSNWPLVTGLLQTAANSAQNGVVRAQINVTTRQMECAALLYRLTGEKRFFDEAVRRGDELVALNPAGATSYVNQDQATRQIATALSKALDYLASDLDATRRVKWQNNVRVRTNEIFAELTAGSDRLDQYPFESHAVTNIGFLALISALNLGDIPEAKTWFEFVFRFYVSSLSPWGGPEGGFANGTAYGEFALDYNIQIWQPLAQATGVNLFKKPWSQGFLNFFMYFLPPGTQTHLFGDAQETTPVPKFTKAFASRFNSPAAAWYAKNLVGNEDPLSMLQADFPLAASTATSVTAPPNAAVFPSIGWAAMHSDMADRSKTSLYFKSSPYGSFNHSHGEQNTFVLKSAGVPLISGTGWYDYYGSPMWADWYRQTKATNGITYDGGIGQMVGGYGEMFARNGRITSFSSFPDVDYVAGEATPSYGGALTAALRRVWYLRKLDQVVIFDQVSAKTPHKYEWNFHAPVPIVTDSSGNISITNQGRKVCVRPVITAGLKFERPVGPAPKPGTVEAHGRFTMQTAAANGEFLMVLDVGCKNPVIKWSDSAGARVLKIGDQTVNIPR